jgi:PAS domain S-box-containing protein
MVSSLLSFTLIWGSITVALGLTVLALRQRPTPGATAFATLMAAGTWWVATSSIGLFTTDVQRRLLLHRLEWFGLVVIPVAWLLFALEYTSRDEYVTKRNVAALALVPGVTLGLVFAGAPFDLVYAARTVNVYGDISIVEVTYGPWFWAYTAYAYALLGAGTLLVLQLVVGARSVYRSQALALLITVFAPWTGNLIFVAGYSPVENLDITPFMFLISGAAGLAALTQFNLLDSVPVSSRIARESVVESMDDGVVVVDADDAIVDINPRGADILGVSVAGAIEASASDLVPAYDALRDAADPEYCETVEREGPHGTRHFEVSMTGLRSDRPGSDGRVVVLHDVTEQRNRIQQLDVLNRVLRHNLRNEMNVVHGYATKLDSDDREAVDRIKQKAMRMVDLGDKAREIDRILDDGVAGDPIEVDSIVEVEVDRARERFPDVTFSVDDAAVAARVSRTLGPVLRNLLENAAQHNDAADPTVEVTVTSDDRSVSVAVADDGPGIPEQERSVLRTREETPLEHSSGLGLWLVNWGVQTMGGSITVECPDDGGSVVTVELPAASASVPVSRQ